MGLVNGSNYDFVHIKLAMEFGLPVFLESINYSDEVDREIITGSNGMPAGVGDGDYKGTVDLEMGLSDAALLNVQAQTKGGVYGTLLPFTATVTYGDAGQPLHIDVLQFVINKRDFSNKKGDKAIKRKFNGLLTAPIVEDGTPAIVRV